ncbi:MAG: type II toxin-antitoxin system death-on-curing family toxin [Candidatus Nanoarchaeia archaeon]
MEEKVKTLRYLDSAQHVIELNKLAIKLFVQKKSDKHEVLSYSKIKDSLKNCILTEGDVYDKAVALLKSLVKAHAFASGNRRTAVLATLVFCGINDHKIYIPNNPTNSRTLIGIRENYYEDNELKNWLKNGKIREFKRK